MFFVLYRVYITLQTFKVNNTKGHTFVQKIFNYGLLILLILLLNNKLYVVNIVINNSEEL